MNELDPQQSARRVTAPPPTTPDIAFVVAVLSKWKWLILAAAVLGGAGAYLLGQSRADRYEAQALMVAETSKLVDSASTDVHLFLASYVQLLNGRSTAAGIHAMLAEPYKSRLSLEDVVDWLDADIVSDTSMLRLRASAPDGATAAALANAGAAFAVARNEETNRSSSVQARDYVADLLTQAGDRLAAARKAASDANANSGLSEIDGRISMLLGEVVNLETRLNRLQVHATELRSSDYREQLLALDAEIGRARSDQAIAEARRRRDALIGEMGGLEARRMELERAGAPAADVQAVTQRLDASRKTAEDLGAQIVASETKLQELLIRRASAASELARVTGIRLSDLPPPPGSTPASAGVFIQPEAGRNDTYALGMSESATAAQRKVIAGALAERRRDLQALQVRRAATAQVLERLNQEQRLANAAFELLSTEYDRSSLSLAARGASLRVLVPAVVPPRPVAHQTQLLSMVGSLAGLLLAMLAVLFREFSGREEPRKVVV